MIADTAAGAPGATFASSQQRLSDDLLRACLKRLRREWECCNAWYLGRRLTMPAFELDEASSRLGAWHRATRTISIARRHVEEDPWSAVVDTLKHEMAHQVVDEDLRMDRALPHGEAFRRAAKLLGVEPSGSGTAAGTHRGQDDEAAARLRKIRGLLALAESPNRHEAEAALAKANELLLKYNIDMAAAETERRYAYRHLGEPTGRRARHIMILAGLLAEHFFVEAIWVGSYDARTGREGTVLEICGTPENVELAEYVWHEIQRSAEALWRRHKRLERLGADRDRRPFLEGVVTGYSERLRAEQKRRDEKHELVWVGDPQLTEFFRTRHPRIRNQSFSISSGSDAFGAGVAAGASLEITRALKARGREGTKLLPGPSA